jgi:Undecaprenyl-phosphate glucose phosphotransferase
MFNAEARKYKNEEVLPVSPAPDVARRNQEDADVAPSLAPSLVPNVDPSDGASGGANAAARVATVPVADDVAPDRPVRPPYSPIVLADSVRLFELLLVFLGGMVAYVACVMPFRGFDWIYVAASGGIAVATMIAFQVADIYQVQAFRGHERQYFRLMSAWSFVFLVLMGTNFLSGIGDEFSLVWLSAFSVLGLVVLLGFRKMLFLLVRSWTRAGRLERRTAIVGADTNGENLVHSLNEQNDSDLRIIGMFDDRGDERAPASKTLLSKLGTVDDLVEIARRTRIDLVIVSLPVTAETRILQMLKKLWVLPVDIRLAAHNTKLRFRPRAYSYIGKLPVLDVIDRPITDWDVATKWLFDKFIGGMALLAASPIMLLTALAIKIDSRGPVFFKQKRYGFNNELIEVFKFRSMYIDKCDATASQLVQKSDQRVTRVGAFIRKASIDELPQLINVVFKGNLSLVGPRPHAVHAKAASKLYNDAVDGYFARHRVKPGITGWAQINGWRGETDTEEKLQRRVEHDLYYIENWSALFDLRILAMTPLALIKAESAY